jgi:hypothetical protein
MKGRDSLNIFRPEKSPGTKMLSGKDDSFSSYWTPPLSLVVENAQPTKVVMTFDRVISVLSDISSFALAGKSISQMALDATSEILTFTVSVAYIYGDNPILVYDKPSVNPLRNTGIAPSFIMTGVCNVAMTAEYLAVYNSLTTKPSSAIAVNQNKFTSELVLGGVWSDVDSFRMLAQTINSDNEALKDWKDVTKVATLNGTTPPVFTSGVGFEMLASANRYIDLLWKPRDGVNYTLNSASILLYISKDAASAAGAYDLGVYDGTYWMQVFRHDNDESIVVNGGNQTPAITDITGLLVCNRTSATVVEIWHRGLKVGTYTGQAVQVNTPNLAVWLGCRHDSPNVVQSPSSRQYSLVGFGKTLTDAKVGILTNSFNRYFNYGKYGTLNPFVQTDFSEANLATLRTTIKGRIWPGGYPATGKDHITTGVASPLLTDSANLDSVDQLTFHIAGIADRTPFVWHPNVSNGKFVIWHLDHFYSYSGTDIWESMGRADCIRALLDDGYTVCGIYMPPSNAGVEGDGHSYPTIAAPYQTVTDLHYFLDTSIRVLNEYAGQFDAFYMAGHSGGAWTTTMISALDERIIKSAGNSGTLPKMSMDYMGHATDWEQDLVGLTDLVEYCDLYVMGTTNGRHKRQYLNANESPNLTGFNLATYKAAPYVDLMAAITNRFKLEWDTITTTHSVSASTKDKIINFFNA